MKAKLLFIALAMLFFSCKKTGDKYLGKWVGGDDYLIIENGGSGYHISEYQNGKTKPSGAFAEFKDGCFFIEHEGYNVKALCDDGEGLIAGKTGKKYKKW